MNKIKRIFCLALVVIIIALYVTTFVLAIIGNEVSEKWFMASLYATVIFPACLYIFTWLVKLFSGKEE